MKKYFLIYFIITLHIIKLHAGWYSNWSYRKPITNNFAVGGDLTNYPLLVVMSNDTDLQNYASNNGHDILFTLIDGTTRLSHELEYYSSGTIVAWIKIPIFSFSQQDSNILYMYFGNASAGNQQNTEDVWDINYKGVWHLSQDPADAAPQMLDSTVNARHGIVKSTPAGNSPVRVTGQAGYCLEFSDESEGISNWVEIPLLNYPELTVELWGMRYNVDPVNADGFFGGRYWTALPNDREGYDISFGAGVNNNKISFAAFLTNTDSTNSFIQNYTVGAEINTWHYIAGTVDRANL
ncbi:MAG TPA: hypothetical protein DC049_10240, partial [Spirochaetia bacterium]|nr:hypothetical protein [Spirochaetia bacterium]